MGHRWHPFFTLFAIIFVLLSFMDLIDIIGFIASLLGIYSFLKNDTSLFSFIKKSFLFRIYHHIGFPKIFLLKNNIEKAEKTIYSESMERLLMIFLAASTLYFVILSITGMSSAVLSNPNMTVNIFCTKLVCAVLIITISISYSLNVFKLYSRDRFSFLKRNNKLSIR